MLLSRHREHLYLRVELEEIHRGWTTSNYYYCVAQLGQACSVLIIFTPRQGFFCVSSVHTHARDLLEWNCIIRDNVIRASHETIINTKENNEPTLYFVCFFS